MPPNASRTRLLKTKMKRSGRHRPAPRGQFLYVLIVAALVAGFCVARFYLQRRTLALGIQWEQQHRELQVVVKEQENLRMERETYTTGDYITGRAKELNLNLPLPGQVRRMRQPEPIIDAFGDADLAASGEQAVPIP